MTILEYYEGMAAIKRMNHVDELHQEAPLTVDELRNRYGSYVLVSRKKRGAGKGYKEKYEWRWRDRKSYLAELRRLFPKEYGLHLCKEEKECLVTETWWNTPNYREAHIKEYRNTIKAISKEYGLSRKDTAEFMRVEQPLTNY